MIDLDHGPTVFTMWIIVAAIFPILYGIFLVDANWEKHQNDADDGDDAFN